MSLIMYALFVTVGSAFALAFMSFFALAKRADEQREKIFAILGENCHPINSVDDY
jgi:hypothetical protein